MKSDTATLLNRLYFEEPYFALARIVGYLGIPATEAVEKLKPLTEKYGKPKMAAVAEAIVRVDDTAKPPMAYLKDHVQPLCWQLLGPPPDKWEEFYKNTTHKPKNPYIKPDPITEEPKAEPK